MKKFFMLFAVLAATFLMAENDRFFTAGARGICRFGDGKNNELLLEYPYINYLAKSADGKTYYAALGRIPGSKRRGGAVVKMIYSAGVFNAGAQISLEGRTPSHITLSPDETRLYTANYSNGDIAEIDLTNAGKVRFIRHSGQSILKRQRAPHPHQCLFAPDGKALYVCDLGTDEIFIYEYNAQNGICTPAEEKLKLSPGSGPRHLVFAPNGNTLYCANELSGTVTTFVRSGGKWLPGKTVSTLQEPFDGNYPGAIKISGCGKFVLVSNRGHNSIALFETAGNGGLALLETVKVKGNFPYDILFLNNDKLVAVCNYKSGTLEIFSFNKAEKKLLPAAEYPVKQAKALID